MELQSHTFSEGEMIPERCAYGRLGEGGKTVASENLNPHLAWTDAPEGTKSFVVACLDDDVPTNLEERDHAGEIPAGQIRRRFVHWVQADVAPETTEFPEGALRHGVKTPKKFGLPASTTTAAARCLSPEASARATTVPARPSLMPAATITASRSRRSTSRISKACPGPLPGRMSRTA